MRIKFKSAIFVLSLTLLAGCGAKKDNELYNLTPDQWYNQILNDIKDADLESADKHYISFASEHIASPYLEQVLMILANAHVDEEEYKMANFYLDEYIKKYGTKKSIEYIQYLKIKANFDSFSKPNRNQKLVQDSIAQINEFLKNYPNTQYRALLETMLIKFRLADYYLNVEIQELYNKLDREDSAKIYQEKIDNSPLNDINSTKAKLPWYMTPFE
ncbi:MULTISPECIES: outer membrane protein assembly factor BamD [Campylobacter]|uniref:Beta-barrel assembly machinery complex, BamD/YfiO lipoprotein n=1 Tax=Campylobacter vicugnae TaxID=1660076 RepID=A0A1X9T1A9_9BACT|nr:MULTISPECIES: outer membrane protein assembly factor BamD [Campylobacter]MCR8689856.1 outer membrane protein assembly factor BamD [Campylobacter sp. RM9264]MCR8700546.1 outer membrane protein assembly factor BamD [Campylobacter sp. RM12176]ARR02253.1 beta-barrel assembly machinery complex, BamD/YfiO lipoprotein [Campylobacter sp. RM8964]ARR03884.1 beta-barrel assembly machinery complex, BamD/YfiO lipoprotein [Campylobacter sp. RM12175]MBE6430773.1 outer membrane protein assembly factor BamD